MLSGAALLGAGGGGDPYIGKLVAMGAVRECGPVTLLDPEEIADDALIVPIAMMGAPTVLNEKAIGGSEYQTLYDMISRFLSVKRLPHLCPSKLAVSTVCCPLRHAPVLVFLLWMPTVWGRAFPELQMVTFTIGGLNATPMALTDEKGNSVLFPNDY